MRLEPFDSVVEEHGPMVMRVCKSVLRGQEAEDAWSETFLSALSHYPELRPGSNVRAWLATIAYRKAIDVTRGAKRREIPVSDMPERASADEELRLVRNVDLADALATLTARQRSAVVFHYVAGLSYKEIESFLEGSAEAIRRSAADGISKLRQALMPEGTRIDGSPHAG